MSVAETFHPVSDKTARRVAEAVERYAGTDPKKTKIEDFLTEHMLLKLKDASVSYQDHEFGYSAGDFMTYPYESFLRAKRGLEAHGVSDDYIALVNSDYLILLMKQTKFIADSNVAKVQNNGIIDMLAGVPLLKISAKRMPCGCAYILMTKELYDLLYGMYCDGSIQTDENIADLIKAHDRDIITYMNLEELKYFESVSTESETRNKTVLAPVGHAKEKSTNRMFYVTARNMDSLPVPVYGTALAMSTSSDPFYTAVEFSTETVEITPLSSQTAYLIVETLSTLLPVAYSYGVLHIKA